MLPNQGLNQRHKQKLYETKPLSHCTNNNICQQPEYNYIVCVTGLFSIDSTSDNLSA